MFSFVHVQTAVFLALDFGGGDLSILLGGEAAIAFCVFWKLGSHEIGGGLDFARDKYLEVGFA